MDIMKRSLAVPVFGVLALALAAPASAQFGRPSDRSGYYGSGPAYDNGYREGIKEGEKDARSRDAFEFRDEGDWRDGDHGYRGEYGDRSFYRRVFRDGFEAGYADGYRRHAGNTGWGRGQAGRYPGYPAYPNRAPGGYGYPGSYPYPNNGRYGYHPAYDAGVRDGYEKGREDARDRDSYDPRRHSWYRSGDHHYRDEYGSREQYRDLYRQAFRDGYDRGYREAGYYGYGR
jgi:hypothetical protein